VDASPWLDLFNLYFDRTRRLVTTLVDLHLDVAMQEATQERKRLISGFILLSAGVSLLSMAGVLLQLVAVLVIHNLGLSWLSSVLAVIALDSLIGIIFAAAALRRLSGPYMRQTQSRLARTTAILARQSAHDRGHDRGTGGDRP
jgi:hypothetical protein